jgi:hypothetical protein
VIISNVVFLGSEMRLTNDSSDISTVYITVCISLNLTSRFFGIVLSFILFCTRGESRLGFGVDVIWFGV